METGPPCTPKTSSYFWKQLELNLKRLCMSGNSIRVGIIGSGFISDYHIQGLQMAGAEVVAISSLKEENALKKAQQYHIPRSTGDYKQILDMSDIQGVVILTPDFTHRQVAIEATQAGKAILLQKPMARSSSECKEIISAAKQARVGLYVSFMHRYFEEVEALHSVLKARILGNILTVRHRNATPGANWAPWFFDREKVGGGVVMQLGIHGIDLLRKLFGEIQAVYATTSLMVKERTLADGTKVLPNNEDLALSIYRFNSGMLTVHEVVYNEVAGTDRFRMEVYGDQGTAWLRTERGRLALYAPDSQGRAGWFEPRLPEPNFGYRQHRHFLDMLLGKEPHDGSDLDGLASVQIAEAIYLSAEKGEWQEVNYS
jgi:predicted dehydrogenase